MGRDPMAAFGRYKAQRLERADRSRSGALDERAAGVVRLLNRNQPFCTTSSCAGRIVLAQGRAVRSHGLPGAVPSGGMASDGMPSGGVSCDGMPSDGMPCDGMPSDGMPSDGMPCDGMPCDGMPCDGMPSVGMPNDGMLCDGMLYDGVLCAVPKRQCRWLLVSHEPCGQRDVMAALEKATGDVVFKFEPFVLHVMCRELQDAQLLHSVAMESGFKNSGITIGKGGKIMMAVRSAHCLEVPLSHMGKLMVSEEYIEFLVHVANQKMEENARRIDRFYKHLEAALEAAGGASSSPSTDTGQARAVYVRRRKRRTARVQDVLPSPERPNKELEPGDDPEGNLDIFAGITL